MEIYKKKLGLFENNHKEHLFLFLRIKKLDRVHTPIDNCLKTSGKSANKPQIRKHGKWEIRGRL